MHLPMVVGNPTHYSKIVLLISIHYQTMYRPLFPTQCHHDDWPWIDWTDSLESCYLHDMTRNPCFGRWISHSISYGLASSNKKAVQIFGQSNHFKNRRTWILTFALLFVPSFVRAFNESNDLYDQKRDLWGSNSNPLFEKTSTKSMSSLRFLITPTRNLHRTSFSVFVYLFVC